MKRRTFLIGGTALVGGGIFALRWMDSSTTLKAATLVAKGNESSFGVWLKIAADDAITIYSPHVEMGQGAHTALAQMLIDELDGDWSKVRVEQAPADPSFANPYIGIGFLQNAGVPKSVLLPMRALTQQIAKRIGVGHQPTWGSMSVSHTGQFGMRTAGAAVRKALLETAASKLNVDAGEVIAVNSVISHPKSGRQLRYGELAAEAAMRSLDTNPTLKQPRDFKLIGKDVARLDLREKVTAQIKYGMDFSLPDMRVATIKACPVRGGKLKEVDIAPAMAITGVEAVLKLDNAVAVVAKGYWQASKGMKALTPQFDFLGNEKFSTDSIFAAQAKLIGEKTPTKESTKGDFAAAIEQSGVRTLVATYKVPFLHHAPMEPYVLTAHFKDGKLDVWGGLQDPLKARYAIAEFSGLSFESVMFHPQNIGGGFGRRNVSQAQVIKQVVEIAMKSPYPVKLIWSREEDVQQGCYRPQATARLTAGLDAKGSVKALAIDYSEPTSVDDTGHRYGIPSTAMRYYEHDSNQVFGVWRSVNYSHHAFYVECMMDELAQLAGIDPYQFRRKHLADGSRNQRVLDEVAKMSGWSGKLPAGVGRGIAIVEGHGTVVAQVIEASWRDNRPRVHKVFAVVDCGMTVSPAHARAQVEGGIVMGLSAAIGEAITLKNGVVEQSNFHDYRLLTIGDTPEIAVKFIESGAPIGGLGEPCLPPTAPALVNALFAANGKRVRELPIARAS